MSRNIIVDMRKLASIVAEAKAQGKVVVHCHGVFDLLHIGHIRYFKQAKTKGDILVVTVTPDRFVDKGPHRPAFPEAIRMEAIMSVYCVDYVALNEWPTAEETLRLIRPDIYVKGAEFKDSSSDMTGKIALEEKVVREIGAKLQFAEDIVFSSTHLINKYLSVLPREIDDYLYLFRRRHDLNQILDLMEQMKTLKVAVVGDAILDEYVYCNAIGKSSKDPVLALRYQSEDRFAGGALAVANHLASFVDNVQLFTVIGSVNSFEKFIRDNLASNVVPHFSTWQGAPTVIKRRYLEGYSLSKLLEIYVMQGGEPKQGEILDLSNALKNQLHDFDVVVASDYGHGAVSQGIVSVLMEQARFLAVNTQSNAGNRGFHTISRYRKMNYGCVAEHEFRLETRDLQGELIPMMHREIPKLGSPLFVVTRGRKGCLVRDSNGEMIAVPSFAVRVIDRVGAGDAFLSITSLAAALGAHPEVIGFLGNMAGAEAVGVVGNDMYLDKKRMQASVTSFLK